MTKKPAIVLAGLIIVITGMIFIYESTQPAPDVCGYPGSVETYYPTFEDNIGPCTTLQRAVADMIMVFLFPILFLWPATFLIVMYFFASLISKRSLRKINYRPIIITMIFSILAWFGFLAIDTVRSGGS